METQEIIKSIKKQFMAYRNGIVADTLRAAGMDCYNIIFGLNVPQLAQVAGTQIPSNALAEALWSDTGVRESRLLATYLFVPEEIDAEYALRLMSEVRTQEEADMLSFRLLRRLPFLEELKKQVPSGSYVALALSRY